jgi:ketosteroid isomerase-like protein
MKKLGTVAGAIGVAALTWLVAFSAFAAGNAKQQITELEDKCIGATTTDQALACDDPHEIVVYDFEPPLEYAGAKAVRGDFNNFFDNAKDIKGHFVQMHVVTDGRLGVVYSIQHFTWTSKDGKPMAMTVRVTDALHKVDGQWRIFHTHVSVPVNPANDKGETDLKLE